MSDKASATRFRLNGIADAALGYKLDRRCCTLIESRWDEFIDDAGHSYRVAGYFRFWPRLRIRGRAGKLPFGDRARPTAVLTHGKRFDLAEVHLRWPST